MIEFMASCVTSLRLQLSYSQFPKYKVDQEEIIFFEVKLWSGCAVDRDGSSLGSAIRLLFYIQ